MEPLAGIGTLYLICTGIGSIYIIISFLLGQIHPGGSMHPGGHLGAGGHGHLGGSSQGHIGAAGHGGAAGSTHQIAGTGGHAVSGGGQAGNSANHLGHAGHAHIVLPGAAHHAVHSQSNLNTTSPAPAVSGFASRAGRLLLTILSPMTISIFLMIFGVSGLLLIKISPPLAGFTVIPAALIGFFIVRLIMNLISRTAATMDVTSVTRSDELIGLAGKVTIAIEDGSLGKIAYVANGMRSTSLARAANPGSAFKIGDRIMIADFQNQIAYVQPWGDEFFPGHDEIKQLKEAENCLEDKNSGQD